MAFTKKNYVDLTGLSTFKSSLLGTVINDSNKATTSKTATIKAIADYVDSEVGDLSSAVTAELAKKVSSVTYDSTNKKLVYNKGGSTNTDIVTVATLKSAIGNFVKSGTGASAGLVPAPSTTAGTSKYLREDGTWVTPPNTTYSVFGKSGSGASTGLVPKPSTTAGTSKYLREDGSWVTPPDTNTTYTNATTSQAGLMGADDKAKLNGIATGAEVNQNAFSNVTVGNVTVSADSKTDTLTLVAGSNVTITPDATNDKITISSSYVNTTYSAGTDLGLSGTTFNHANSGVTAGTYKSVTVNARGHVTGGTNPTTLSGYGITDAKIASGVITLGSNTITPLTSASTLAAGKVSGTLATSNIPNLDASKITTGTISVDRLPATALERCVVVADDTARFALTTSSVQVGDTVKVTATKKMYMVIDSSKLSTAAGYEEYFTSTDWSTITNKPSSYTPSSHTHTKAQITDFPSSMPASDVYAWAKAKTKPSYAWSEITDKPTSFTPASHTHTKSQITDFPSSMPASDVYDWAKAKTKPSYAWSEITSKPSTFTPASHTQGEATLTWGGRNFAGTYGPIDASMIPELGANRLAFGNSSGITIEYSRDGGSTWTDYGASADNKVNLFSPPGAGFSIGKADSNNKATANYLLRVTINTSSFGVYTALNKFMIYCSTNGSTGSYCSIDAALESTPTTFVNFANKVPISGWSGYNIINTSSITTYGNSPSSQYGRLRFTFGCTGGSTSYSGLNISKIYGFGGVGWTAPSNLARTGHIYSIGSGQSVTFPGLVTATGGFSGSLLGTASKATNDSAGQPITTTYIKGLSVSGKTITYTKGDGSKGTINTQDTTYSSKTAASGGTDVSLVTTGEKYTWNNKANAFTVTNGGNTASWGKSVTVGTVAGTSLTFTMPANPNTDTHYTAKNVVASSSTGTANVTVATSNPYLNLIENGAVRSAHQIKGSGATTVKTDTSGNIIISSTDTNTTNVSATTTGSGNAVTAITASGSAITVTKGATFLTSHQDISGKENTSNKVKSWSSTTTDDHYPSEKLVKSALDGKYAKPSGGIPKSDLASAVQTSLGKADTALQVHQDISGKENTSNKVKSWSSTTTDDHYPSEKLVKSALDGKSSTTHGHGNITKDGKIGTASDKLVITTTGGALTTKTTTVGGDNQPIYLKEGTPTAIGITLGTIASKSTADYLASTLRGAKNGVASLDASGKVPSSQLPSYVDDVLEYSAKSGNNGFPAQGETGKIYVDTSSNLTYRWSGSAYVEISPSLALGETSSTAYAGDKGKTLATNLSNHTSNKSNPHSVTKAQVGLGNVDNTSDANKPISNATQTALNKKSDTTHGHGNITKDGKIGTASNKLVITTDGGTLTTKTTSLGSAKQPIYLKDGTPTAGTALGDSAYKGVDTTPTSGSANVITSGGVYTAISNFDYRGRANTWSAVNTFSNGTDVTSGSSTASGAIIASKGGIWAAGGIRGNKVYNAVWNDLADCIPVDDECELIPGYCYCFDGEKYYKSSKYLDDGIIGVHSDTYGMHMGYKDNCKQMDVAVAGFVLAYVDKEYPSGTPLTCTENGYLTKIEKSDKIEYPEKIVATYWKNEPSEYWGGEKDKIKVNGRKWVKIK